MTAIWKFKGLFVNLIVQNSSNSKVQKVNFEVLKLEGQKWKKN